MTIQEFAAKLDDLVVEIPAMIMEETEVAALNGLALVDNRITSTGTNENGAPFQDYTPSYKKYKEKAGRYRGHVDFMLSGEMLASTTTGFENITESSKSLSGANASITFDGRDELTKKKLDGNNTARPGFLNLSKDEIKNITGIANVRLEKKIIAALK